MGRQAGTPRPAPVCPPWLALGMTEEPKRLRPGEEQGGLRTATAPGEEEAQDLGTTAADTRPLPSRPSGPRALSGDQISQALTGKHSFSLKPCESWPAARPCGETLPPAGRAAGSYPCPSRERGEGPPPQSHSVHLGPGTCVGVGAQRQLSPSKGAGPARPRRGQERVQGHPAAKPEEGWKPGSQPQRTQQAAASRIGKRHCKDFNGEAAAPAVTSPPEWPCPGFPRLLLSW